MHARPMATLGWLPAPPAGDPRDVMGRFTSPLWVNICGWIATVLMGVGAIGLLVVAALGG